MFLKHQLRQDHLINFSRINESHFMENSYYIKDLNRNPNFFKTFESKMKEVYKERTSDKISKAIDTVDMISSIIDTIK